MTEFSVSPRWYPAYAFPILLGTVIAAVLMPRVITVWERFQSSTSRDNSPPYTDLGRGRTIDRVETGSMNRHRRRDGSWPRVESLDLAGLDLEHLRLRPH